MNYTVQNSEDFSAGAVLTIYIPEEELDKKALYTIQADQPPYLVPFNYIRVDGQIKLNYRLGKLTKLVYRFGPRNTAECVEFWENVLQPLLDCDDWFLNPLCFALETQYMYVSGDDGTVKYLYIPSKNGCVEQGALKQLTTELLQKNPVNDDMDLENKLLKSIMQDFRPTEFLKVLRNARPAAPVFNSTPQIEMVKPQEEEKPEIVPKVEQKPEEQPKMMEPVQDPWGSGDIKINLRGSGKSDNKKQKPNKKEKKSLFGSRNDQKIKKEPKKSDKNKEAPSKGIMIGAVEEPIYRNFAVKTAPAADDQETESEVTRLIEGGGWPYLRFVGEGAFPTTIQVKAEIDQPFTIGRFDVSVGRKQCSFEFEKDTPAVSRHHAAIEKLPDGSYAVIDQNSKAGTFVNGLKIVPNSPKTLEQGCKVSFGTGGANYVWEE